ncbi:expressed protein [Chlorella variabilis]|uniref:Expressed protein n=1 Tax=Chlorella variabilis TaxID=554065 RepID=E1ZRN0_CHLVA|nr:expressed protein [Chlorella variabilis]EFN51439.1 expressed protein [Chlorella variabilis]|eukprot:XP_005843541.1 expressed protein [Chlorella variabilis]
MAAQARDPQAALLSDLAALKLQEGDAEGAEQLFRKALEAQQQRQAGGTADADADDSAEADSWEAWDEASALPPQPAAPAAASRDDGDGWEAAAAAAAASSRSRPAPCGGGTFGVGGPASSSGSASADALPFGGGHVLELYDLTPAVRTQHLEAFLERFCGGHPVQPTLKWVDDCHAAVVCADPQAARQLLGAATAAGTDAEFRLRGYADAGSGTRKLPASELQTPKPRPATSTAVARRLIGGALNMRLRDKDAEQQLAATRRQQREEREERQKALDATWEA